METELKTDGSGVVMDLTKPLTTDVDQSAPEGMQLLRSAPRLQQFVSRAPIALRYYHRLAHIVGGPIATSTTPSGKMVVMFEVTDGDADKFPSLLRGADYFFIVYKERTSGHQ